MSSIEAEINPEGVSNPSPISDFKPVYFVLKPKKLS